MLGVFWRQNWREMRESFVLRRFEKKYKRFQFSARHGIFYCCKSTIIALSQTKQNSFKIILMRKSVYFSKKQAEVCSRLNPFKNHENFVFSQILYRDFFNDFSKIFSYLDFPMILKIFYRDFSRF